MGFLLISILTIIQRRYKFQYSQINLRMKGPLTLIKPLKQRSKSAITHNMFQDPEAVEETPVINRPIKQAYDIVGSQEFRKKFLTKYGQPMKPQELKQPSLPQNHPFNQTRTSKNGFNTTIQRTTLLDSLQKEQQIEYTKQTRNIEKYKEYQQLWERKKSYIKNTLNKNPILMENSIKPLYVHPNQAKIDTINNYIVHYWEMSLRNNNPILERHIKGHRFDPVQKQKLLQFREGTRRVQSSIPSLPIEKLKDLKKRELSLSGRNKVKKEADSESINQTRYSVPNSARLSQQEEVLKIDYDGDKKWLGTQNI